MSNSVVLSIGSNSADCIKRVRLCVDWLGTILNNAFASDAYKTPALNGVDNDYLNAVAIGKTNIEYDEFKAMTKKYEQECGRTPESKSNGVIPIDIDVVLWNRKLLKERDFKQNYFQKGWMMLEDWHDKYGID